MRHENLIMAVDGRKFANALQAVSTNETRYYISGVYVETHPEGGATLTATNGHWIIKTWDRTGYISEPAIIRPDVSIVRAIKAKKYKSDLIAIGGPSGVKLLASMTATTRREEPYTADQIKEAAEAFDNIAAAQFRNTTVDGIFPDYRRTIPSGELVWDEGFGIISAHVIGPIFKAVGTIDRAARQKDVVNGPVLMIPHGDADTVIVAMPMRTYAPHEDQVKWSLV